MRAIVLLLALVLSLQTLCVADNPTATPAVSPGCAIPNRDATAVVAVLPNSTGAMGIQPGTVVLVDIEVLPSGKVGTASVNKGSSNLAADQAAIRAAKASYYTPRFVNCVAVASHYIYRISFNGDFANAPQCSAPDTDAKLLQAAPLPWPTGVPLDKPQKVTLKIAVASNGVVTDATVLQSSGTPSVDDAAIQNAKSSAFTPTIQGCKAVDAVFAYEVDFDPTVPQSCAHADQSAQVVKPAVPDYPFNAEAESGPTSIWVLVRVSAAGAVEDVTLLRPSGSLILDQATVRAARGSMYAPGYAHCQAIDDVALFHADISGTYDPSDTSDPSRACKLPMPVLAHPVAPLPRFAFPADAGSLDTKHAFAVVTVDVSSSGLPTTVSITMSSKYEAIDRAAIAVARVTRFVPGTAYCKPAASTVVLLEEFDR